MWTVISQLTSTPGGCTCSRNARLSTILQEVWVCFFVSSSKADVDSASFIVYSPLRVYQYSSHVLMLQPPFCAKSNVDQRQALPPSCSLSWISCSLGHAEQYTPTAFVSWFLEESILQRAARSAWDAQAERQLQPTWRGGGINSVQEERQEKLHGMVLRPELQYAGSAWFLSFVLASIRVTLDGSEIVHFPHLVKFKSSESSAGILL